MKTAVEFLQAEFNKWAEGRVFIPQDILEQAKKMEKEQIMNNYKAGVNAGILYCNGEVFTSKEEYYNKTYNQNE